MTKLMNKILGMLSYYVGVITQDYRKIAVRDYQTFSMMMKEIEKYVGDLKGKTILDVGCGRRYPYTLLLHSLGYDIVGIDTQYVGNDNVLKRYWKELTQNGFKSFCRALIFDISGQKRIYYKTLQNLCGFTLKRKGLKFEIMNVEKMTFPEEAFDLVVSVLCFEHVSNVQKAISEVWRVLKTGGFAYVKIHLFTSRTGGHHLGKQYDFVPPWDHLRENKYPVPEYLNKLRMNEWVKLFSEKFEILEVIKETDPKAEELLTTNILSKLSRYSKEELLTKTITIIARKSRPFSQLRRK